MSYTLDIFVINNGYRVELKNLEENHLDSLRECIYDIISDTAKLNLDCNDEFPNGLLSELTYTEYKQFLNRALHIYPEDKQVWENTVLFFKKPVSSEFKKFKEILNTIDDNVTYVDPLFEPTCNQQQYEHLKSNKPKLTKSEEYFKKPIKMIYLKPYR